MSGSRQGWIEGGRKGGQEEISCVLILVNAAICCACVSTKMRKDNRHIEDDTDTGRSDDLWWITVHMETRASITRPSLYRPQMRNHHR